MVWVDGGGGGLGECSDKINVYNGGLLLLAVLCVQLTAM